MGCQSPLTGDVTPIPCTNTEPYISNWYTVDDNGVEAVCLSNNILGFYQQIAGDDYEFPGEPIYGGFGDGQGTGLYVDGWNVGQLLDLGCLILGSAYCPPYGP